MEECKGCKFFEGLYKDSATGFCKRHAPRPFVTAGGVDGGEWTFPMVAATEWCGEFTQRPTKRAPDAGDSSQ